MPEDALYDLLTMTVSYLPNEDFVRNTIEKFCMLDAPAVVKRVMKTDELAAFVPMILDATDDMDVKRITEYVISFYNPYYPNVVNEVVGDEKKAQLVADSFAEGVRVIRDGNNK